MAFVSALVLPFAAYAADEVAPPVSLAWNRNPETDVAGYKVHFGTQSGTYSSVITVPVAAVTEADLPEMIMGRTYYLAVSAYNTAGLEGPRSAEFSVTAAVPSPAEGVSFSMSAAGSGTGNLKWKHPKSASGTTDGYTVYASEDLARWTETARLTAANAVSSDSQWLYFNFTYQATKPRMFFRVKPDNAFGETE